MGPVLLPFRESDGNLLQRNYVETFTGISLHDPETGLAQSRRLFEHRIEHRREIAG